MPIKQFTSEHSGCDTQETHVYIQGHYFGFNLISLCTYSRTYIKFSEHIVTKFLQVYI
jgi:hypothetical protein